MPLTTTRPHASFPDMLNVIRIHSICLVTRNNIAMKRINQHPDFEFFNPNKHKCGDCSIRAIVKVTGKDWVNVFDELCAIGRKMQRMPNDMKCIEKYLAGHGFTWVAIKSDCGTRPTVLDVVNWSRINPGNRYIARVAHHVVPVMDGKFYDLADWSAGKSLYGYFIYEP